MKQTAFITGDDAYLHKFVRAVAQVMPIARDIPYFAPPRRTRGKFVKVRTKPKIGRNESCPCGSGKKYKKCCMNKDRNT